jgi:hypothetical protein
MRMPDYKLDIPSDSAELERRLVALFPEAAENCQRFVTEIRLVRAGLRYLSPPIQPIKLLKHLGEVYCALQYLNRTFQTAFDKTTGWKLAEDRKSITITDKIGIGKLKLKGTRDLNFYQPDQIKRVRLVKRADGYCVQFCISVDRAEVISPTKSTIGLDMGLNHFYTDSNGEQVENPRSLSWRDFTGCGSNCN